MATILTYFVPEIQYHILLEISKFFSAKQLEKIEEHLIKNAKKLKESKTKTNNNEQLNKLFDPLILGMRSG